MKHIFAVDAALIRFFEKIAHGVQRVTGKNNFWFGWTIFWARVVWGFCEILFYAEKKSISEVMSNIIVTAVIFMLLQFVTKWLLDRWVSSFNSQTVRTRNPLENSFFGKGLRLCGIAFLMGTLFSLLVGRGKCSTLVDDVLHISMWYVFSCTPLPPGESLLSKMLASIRSFFGSSSAHAGASA
jgi:hypothetical protein